MKKYTSIILTGSMFMLVGSVIRLAFSFLRNIYVGRTLGPEILGTFTMANTIYGVLAVIALFGMDAVLNRFIPQFRDSDNRGLNSVIGTALKFATITSLLLVIVTIIISPMMSTLFNDDALKVVLTILIITLPFQSGMMLITAAATAFETTKLQALERLVIVPLLFFLFVIIFNQFQLDEIVLPLSFLLANVVSFISSVILAKYSVLKNISLLSSWKYFDKRYLLYAWPLFGTKIVYFFMAWFDTFAIGYFLSPREVGIYVITLLIVEIPVNVLIALNSIFFPTIAGIISRKEVAKVTQLYQDAVRVLGLITLPMFGFLLVYAPELMQLFGEGFRIPFGVIIFLTLSALLRVMSGPVGMILNGFDRHQHVFTYTLVGLFVGVMLNLYLIPRIGLMGAAIANASVYLIQNYLGILELFIVYKIQPYTQKVVGLVIVAGLLTYGLYGVHERLIEGLNYHVVGLILIAGVFELAFLVLVWGLKIYEPKDKNLLLNFLRKPSEIV